MNSFYSSVKESVENLGFDLELSDSYTNFDYNDPRQVENFIDSVTGDFKLDNNSDITKLNEIINKHKNEKMCLSKDELKEVYLKLKNRELHPKGEFDKAGRFWLDDDELVNVRTPSARYPYSQMNAGRTSKFVKAMAEKYKPKTLDEFLTRFVKK